MLKHNPKLRKLVMRNGKVDGRRMRSKKFRDELGKWAESKLIKNMKIIISSTKSTLSKNSQLVHVWSPSIPLLHSGIESDLLTKLSIYKFNTF